MEASTHELDRRGERRRLRPTAPETHLVVRVLEGEADKCPQTRREEIVLGRDAPPTRLARRDLRRKAQGNLVARRHTNGAGNRRPDVRPAVDIAIGDVERLVA